MTTPVTLSGKVALITGGGRGIGRAVALCPGRAGASLALTPRTRARLEAVAAELRAAGARKTMIQDMDVTDPEPFAAGLRRVRAALAPIDILVNDAGIAVLELCAEKAAPRAGEAGLLS